MVRHQPTDSGPLSRRFDISTVRDLPATFTVTASEAECAALASEAGLKAIEAFSAAFDIVRDGQDGFRVTGTVRAQIRQTCVVSLDDISSRVEEPIDVVFLPEAEVARMAAERGAEPAHRDEEETPDDLPDPIVGNRIDLGALAAEVMILGLDPYPRKPGVVFAEPEPPSAAEVSPFAALKQLNSDGA